MITRKEYMDNTEPYTPGVCIIKEAARQAIEEYRARESDK